MRYVRKLIYLGKPSYLALLGLVSDLAEQRRSCFRTTSDPIGVKSQRMLHFISTVVYLNWAYGAFGFLLCVCFSFTYVKSSDVIVTSSPAISLTSGMDVYQFPTLRRNIGI